VFSVVKAPVEKSEIANAQASAGHHCFSHGTLVFPGVVVWHYSSR
jgi:hypothetical protein